MSTAPHASAKRCTDTVAFRRSITPSGMRAMGNGCFKQLDLRIDHIQHQASRFNLHGHVRTDGKTCSVMQMINAVLAQRDR